MKPSAPVTNALFFLACRFSPCSPRASVGVHPHFAAVLLSRYFLPYRAENPREHPAANAAATITICETIDSESQN